MNAHQRRIERRKPRMFFDMETYPMVGDFFDFASVANGIEPLSHTIKILKEREAAHNGKYKLLLDGMDFTRLEERIVASLGVSA